MKDELLEKLKLEYKNIIENKTELSVKSDFEIWRSNRLSHNELRNDFYYYLNDITQENIDYVYPFYLSSITNYHDRKFNSNNNSNSKKHKKKHSITNNLSKSKSTENKNSKPFEQEQPITQATKSISVSKVIKDKSLFEQELPIKLNSQDKNKSKNPKLESKIKKAKKKYKHYKKKILKKRNKKKMKKVIKTNK